jgi:hypothetical protein
MACRGVLRVSCLLAIFPVTRSFFPSLFKCCEAKCVASGLAPVLIQACALVACKGRWDGDTHEDCIRKCSEVKGNINRQMCESGCANYEDCDCPGGTYFASPASWADLREKDLCRKCPPGYECPGGPEQPAVCPASTYAAGGASNCSSCPLGRFGIEGGVSSKCSGMCEAGRYGTGSRSTCKGKCPIPHGYYAISNGQSRIRCTRGCKAGRWGSGGSLTPRCSGLCPAGK